MILTNRLTAIEKEKVDQILKRISTMSRQVLKSRLGELQKEVNELINYFGVKANLRQLEFYTNTKNIPEGVEGKYLYISKYHLGQIFEHYEKSLPNFPYLPPHAKIAIDLLGIRIIPGHTEVFQLEMSIFFDMAILWNSSLELTNKLLPCNNVDHVKVKRFNALKRSTVKAAFNLIEAYLNGMGLDIMITQQVSDKDHAKLSEWDKSKSRHKMLSLRDKLLQYPKIALQCDHPPLDENRCKEMKQLLEYEKGIRHALIHPTPKYSDLRPDEHRERFYFDLDIKQVSEIVDLVINSIFLLSNTIGNKFEDPSYWLYKRNESGFFSEEIFK